MKVTLKVKEVLLHEITLHVDDEDFEEIKSFCDDDYGDYMHPSGGRSKTIKEAYWIDGNYECEL